jgi:hypothetical protein
MESSVYFVQRQPSFPVVIFFSLHIFNIHPKFGFSMAEQIPTYTEPQVPALPPRPAQSSSLQPQNFPAPPQRKKSLQIGDDAANPIHYMRDPHKLIAYLVPFPKPDIHKGFLHKADVANIPERFLLYTPPSPPLVAPKEGDKEDKMHKLQRKWQNEVREAKQSDAKVTSWKGVKSRATKGINTAMGWTVGCLTLSFTIFYLH